MTHDRNTLDKMAEHVAYEMWMLHETTRLSESGRYPPQSPDLDTKTIGNALLESSLLHLRSLDDFLHSRRRRAGASRFVRWYNRILGQFRTEHADDVIARDYLPTWNPRKLLTKKERRYINKRLAHVNTERMTGPLPWQLARSHAAYGVCVQFLEAVELTDPQHSRAEFRKVLLWFRPAS